MSFGNRAGFDAVRTSAAAAIAAGYTAVGTALTRQARMVIFQNLLDVGVMISMDGGASDSFPLAANSVMVLDIASNKVDMNGLFVSVGTVISQKRLAGAAATGSLYVSVVYAYGDNN
jgi:hypothetical protein